MKLLCYFGFHNFTEEKHFKRAGLIRLRCMHCYLKAYTEPKEVWDPDAPITGYWNS